MKKTAKYRWSLESRKRRCGSGNPMFGKKQSEKVKSKLRFIKTGERNPVWRGNLVTKSPLHQWVRKRLKQPSSCVECKKKTKFLDLANISQKYKRDLSDWEYLCRKCHMLKDGRLKRFKELGEKARSKMKKQVIQLTKDGKPIKIWFSINSAARSLNVCSSGITRAVNGQAKSCKGFIWKPYVCLDSL